MPQKAYRMRLYPTPAEQEVLRRIIGTTRYMYNAVLDILNREYDAWKANPSLPKPSVTGYGPVYYGNHVKQDPERPWLLETSNVAYQQKLLDLSKAYTNFFRKRAQRPKFKKKSHGGSFRLMTNAFRLKDGRLSIAKCPTLIRVRWSRELPSPPSQVTITLSPSGEYHASFLCEYTPQRTSGTRITGIDLGITSLLSLSDGTVIDNPRHYVAAQARLARLQRRLSRKQKGSHNRHKARIHVARLHTHITNQRRDHLHKLTTTLIRENQAIGIEDLAVSNMGRNRHLAKHIMTAGWGMFRTMLTYKAEASQHCRLVIADRYYPSTQCCSGCGLKPTEKLALKVRSWTCEHCGATHQRDHNAAINLQHVAREGLRMATVAKATQSVILMRDYASYV